MVMQRDDGPPGRTPRRIKVTVKQKGGANSTFDVEHWSVNEHGMLTLVLEDHGPDDVREVVYPPGGYSSAVVDVKFDPQPPIELRGA